MLCSFFTSLKHNCRVTWSNFSKPVQIESEYSYLSFSHLPNIINKINISGDVAMKELKRTKELLIANKYRVLFFPPLESITPTFIEDWFNGNYQGQYWNGCSKMTRLRIDPYGNIYPCMNINFSLGNIRQYRLNQLWNNDKHQKFHQFMTRMNVPLPQCIRCCKQVWQKNKLQNS